MYGPVQVLLMSDELKLDEIYCLLCLLTSHEEVVISSSQQNSSAFTLIS